MQLEPGTIILQNQSGEFPELGPWLRFSKPSTILAASDPAAIPGLLDQIEEATARGAWAAGFLAYEAAPAFDPAFPLGARASSPASPVLCWFGLYDGVVEMDGMDGMDVGKGAYKLSPWCPALSASEFASRVERIREYIAAGDTYQVNFTFPLHARFEGDPFALFLDLQRAQRGRHGAFIMTPGQAIVSASPELFFAQAGDAVVTRPMKGTAPRGRWPAEDERAAAALPASEKDRAENVMIVDLLRNDLGRVALPGTVVANPLFEVERYETVLQMTSTVRARTAAHPVRTLQALFPCGSITGAPKVRTMEIIAELETAPRGVYTGAIGWIGPGRRACFSVAIRTASIAISNGEATYGVGAGITWPSSPEAEYEECLLKARLLTAPRPGFELLETLRWDPETGYFFLEEHVARLAASARYFARPCEIAAVRAALDAAAGEFGPQPRRVRLIVDVHGTPKIELANLQSSICNLQFEFHHSSFIIHHSSFRVALAPDPVDSSDPFLYHKTTHRAVYERARAARPGFDDVLLFNERGELTESTIANLVVDFGDGVLRTPALECGLLPGVFREKLLREGVIREDVISVAALEKSLNLWLINSVRGWMPARLEPSS